MTIVTDVMSGCLNKVDLGGGNMQTALIDLGSSLSVTTPDIAKRSGATLVSCFNVHSLDYELHTMTVLLTHVENSMNLSIVVRYPPPLLAYLIW